MEVISAPDLLNSSSSGVVYATLLNGDLPSNHNRTLDAVESEDLSYMKMYYFVTMMRDIFIPIIAFVGVVGNTISIIVFMSNYFRHVSSSSSCFLTGLACADNIFLLTLFLTWYDGSVVNFIVSVEACQFIGYITYVTSFLSVWFVVGFTVERYVAICHPLHSKILCSNSRERIVAIVLSVFACLMYNYAFWTSDVKFKNGKYRCGLQDQYIKLLETLTWVDSFLTMLLPFFLIAILNVRVVRTSAKFHEKRKQCMNPADALIVKSKNKIYTKQQMRVTRTLLLVSTTFLVLNLPSHVVRIYNLIIYLTDSDVGIGLGLYVAQQITQIIYYTTFGVNFFLYAFYGKHFRKSLSYLLNRAIANCGHQKKSLRLNRTKSTTRSTHIMLEGRHTFRSRLPSSESMC